MQRILIVFLLISSLSGCKKLIDAGAPVTALSGGSVYNNDGTAAAVLTGVYSNISGNFPGINLASLNVYPSLSADELTLYSGSQELSMVSYYKNDLSSQPSINNFWDGFYPTLFVINSAIEGLSASTTLTPAVKQQLLGESKFLRALFYFYLVNLYGDVPLALTTDYKVNGVLPRAPQAQVYQQIIADLKDAIGMLSDTYLDASLLKVTPNRVRPNKWAAMALLARAYLYDKDWADAETQATAVMSNTTMYGLNSLDSVFLKNSREAIWQIQPVGVGLNTRDGWFYTILSTGPDDDHPVYLSPRLLNSFEANDQRATHWINNVSVLGVTYYYPYKYKSATINAPVTEYEMALRLGEQYLIRAEARVHEIHLPDAAADLNVIRGRAGLLPYSGGMDTSSLFTAILHERQVEFFTEYGHRWLDLKRMGAVDSVMSVAAPLKGGSWMSYKQLYPIDLTELKASAALKQNPGYQ